MNFEQIFAEEINALPFTLREKTKKKLAVLKLESWERRRPLTMDLVRELYLTVLAEGKK